MVTLNFEDVLKLWCIWKMTGVLVSALSSRLSYKTLPFTNYFYAHNFKLKKWSEIHTLKYPSENCLTNKRENLPFFNNNILEREEKKKHQQWQWILHLNACQQFSTLSKDNSDTRKRWANTWYSYIFIAPIQQQNQLFTVWGQLHIWPLNYLLRYHQTAALQIYKELKMYLSTKYHIQARTTFYSKKNSISFLFWMSSQTSSHCRM